MSYMLHSSYSFVFAEAMIEQKAEIITIITLSPTIVRK